MSITPKWLLLLCAICLLVAGCALVTAPTLTPEPTRLSTDTPEPPFRPGEHAHLLKLVKDIMSEGFTDRGGLPAITYGELKTACVILGRNNWDLPSFFADPEANGRLSMIAGSAAGGLKALEQLAEEKGLPKYTLVHFCDDAEKSRGSG